MPGTADDRVAVGEAQRIAQAWLEEALLGGDASGAEHAAHLLLRNGCTLSDLYSGVIEPLMQRLGERWQHGDARIAEEHLCSAAARDLVRRLMAWQGGALGQRGQVVLIAPSGEQHLLGLLMLRHALTEDGWTVNHPGPLPLGELPAYLTQLDGVRLVGLSFHDASRQAGMRQDLADLRRISPRLPVIVGGYALRRNPALWQQLGVAGGASDVAGTLELVSQVTNPLTVRESQVLSLVSNGRTNEEIAAGLGVNLSTVKTHLERIYVKSDVRDRAASVATGLRRHWIR